MYDIFSRPQQSTAFYYRPAEMLRAITGIDASNTIKFVMSQGKMKTTDNIDPILRAARVKLIEIGVASLPSSDPRVC